MHKACPSCRVSILLQTPKTFEGFTIRIGGVVNQESTHWQNDTNKCPVFKSERNCVIVTPSQQIPMHLPHGAHAVLMLFRSSLSHQTASPEAVPASPDIC